MFPKKKTNSSDVEETDVTVLAAETRPVELERFEKKAGPPPPLSQPAQVKETAVALAEEEDSTQSGTPADLDRLRDILYGNQVRTTEKRISDLETRLASLRQEMHDLIERNFTSLSTDASSQVQETNRTLGDRLTQQSSEQATQLRTVQHDLTGQIQAQHTELTSQIRTNRRELTEQ